MSLRINTNTEAMNALRNLNLNSQAVASSIERLSSGMRINRASDDPAGLIISEGLRAQIDGLNQAISNSQDASNLIKTAEGGLQEVNSLLRSIRQLAVHAANSGVNDATAVQADQTQIKSALDSIDRIATQTQFGTKRLLDGTSGTNAAVTDTAKLGGIYIGGTFNGAATSAGAVSITVATAATRAAVAGTATYSGASATLGKAGTVVINGQSITMAASDTVQTLINKINDVSGITGVSAGLNSTTISLTQKTYGSTGQINLSDVSGLIASGSTSTSGLNAVATVSIGGGAAVTFTGGQRTGDSGLMLTDKDGNSVLLTEQGNATSVSAATVASVSANSLTFQVGANAGQSVQISIANMQTSSLGTTASSNVKKLQDIDVTKDSSSDDLKVIDQAISQVSVLRAQLGAFQKNTLDSTIRFLGIGAENLSASESQIRDTNVSQEVVNMTKNQILQQAGMSVLAQANQAPQQVLSLLR